MEFDFLQTHLAFSENDDIKKSTTSRHSRNSSVNFSFAMMTYFKRLKLSSIRMTSNHLLNRILLIY